MGKSKRSAEKASASPSQGSPFLVRKRIIAFWNPSLAIINLRKSSKPRSFQYSLHQLAANTRALLASLGIEKPILVAHSMGGMLAMRYAVSFPDALSGLVLVNPIGLEDWRRWVPYPDVETWYRRERDQTYQSMKAYQLKSYYHGRWRPEYEPWLRLAAGPTLSPEYPKLALVSALLYDMIFTQPVCYEFGNLRVPTLLMVGELDRTAVGLDMVPPDVAAKLGDYPRLARETVAQIPDAKLLIFPGVGHAPHLESHAAFISALLEFLK